MEAGCITWEGDWAPLLHCRVRLEDNHRTPRCVRCEQSGALRSSLCLGRSTLLPPSLTCPRLCVHHAPGSHHCGGKVVAARSAAFRATSAAHVPMPFVRSAMLSIEVFGPLDRLALLTHDAINQGISEGGTDMGLRLAGRPLSAGAYALRDRRREARHAAMAISPPRRSVQETRHFPYRHSSLRPIR